MTLSAERRRFDRSPLRQPFFGSLMSMASMKFPAIEFRAATLDDVPAIVDLVHACYRGDSSRQGWTHEADLLDGQRTDADDVSGIISSVASRIVLAETNGQLLGCCQLEMRPDRTAYLGMFAVSPALQGGGIGRSIVDEAERLAAELDAVEMRMSVIRQREDLIAWYLRLGYAHNGETQPFPYGNERFGSPKQDDLEFVILTKAL